MSFVRHTQHTARKQHACIWCPEKIEAGQVYLYEACISEGDFFANHWHPECHEAALEMNGHGDFEIEPQGSKRGSPDEIDQPYLDRVYGPAYVEEKLRVEWNRYANVGCILLPQEWEQGTSATSNHPAKAWREKKLAERSAS